MKHCTLVSQAKICLNWNINNITAEWINNILNIFTNLLKNCTVLQLNPANSNTVFSNFSLFPTENNIPWICSLVKCYRLFRTIFLFAPRVGNSVVSPEPGQRFEHGFSWMATLVSNGLTMVSPERTLSKNSSEHLSVSATAKSTAIGSN